MKTTILTISAILFCQLASAQQPTKELMHLSLPAGTKKMDETQLQTLKARKFDNQKIDFFKGHVYTMNKLLIYYTYLSVAPRLRRSLENRKKLMVAVSKQKADRVLDGSSIITSNNIRYMIINYHEADEYYTWFSSDYDKDGNFINGCIQYVNEDKRNADLYLKEFLPTISFVN